MIERTVEELTPIIGTRPACRALGASPATVYNETLRRLQPALADRRVHGSGKGATYTTSLVGPGSRYPHFGG